MQQVRRFGAWLLRVLGLGAAAGGYLGAVSLEFAPPPAELACLARVHWKLNFADRLPDTRFTIIVANLDRDSNGSQRDYVLDAVGKEPGMHVIRTCQVLKIDPIGTPIELQRAAEARGRSWLDDWDVLDDIGREEGQADEAGDV